MQVARPSYPAPLDMTLAMRVLVHPTELGRQHELEVILQDEDGDVATKVKVGFGVEDTSAIPPGEEASLVIPWNFPMRPAIPHPGRYSFELLIDGVHQTTVAFNALQVNPEEVIQSEPEGDAE